MVRQADPATPNVALYNLRDSRGQSQQDVADAINRVAATLGKRGVATANQVSRWERGVTRPGPFYRQLICAHFGVSADELGLSKPRGEAAALTTGEPARPDSSATSKPTSSPIVAASQSEWRHFRSLLNGHRVPLARNIASLYPHEMTLPGTGVLIHPDWLPAQPVSLSDIHIEHDDSYAEATIVGTEEATSHVRPLAASGRPFHRYSQAIRVLDHPRLFENRVAWYLQDVAWSNRNGHMSFCDSTYFEFVDVCEAVAHETAMNMIRHDGTVESPSWKGLTLRSQIGDPFDLARRVVGASTDTLTIRQDRDGATFVLHDRNAANVAVAGGMLHVMPCGVFQPSSIKPLARQSDFDLWRNIMREYSEEFLGNPEHDGDGPPIDYTAEPFGSLGDAVTSGKARPYCLGVGLDALTLYGEILTVVVFDGDVYDSLFAEMVDANDEGTLVKTGVIHPTPAMPFNEHMINELIDSGRMAPAGAACLRLAWEHRRLLLDN